MVSVASRDSGPRGSRGPILNRILLETTLLTDAERSYADIDEWIGDEDDVAIAAITVAELAAVRRQGRPRGAHDLIIAATATATAAASGPSLVTADRTAFVDLPGIVTISYR
jgi:predicted nucleic acid-binding protein